MKNNKKTPFADGVSNKQYSKSESQSNYTESSLTYKDLCDSNQTRSKEDANEYKL